MGRDKARPSARVRCPAGLTKLVQTKMKPETTAILYKVSDKLTEIRELLDDYMYRSGGIIVIRATAPPVYVAITMFYISSHIRIMCR